MRLTRKRQQFNMEVVRYIELLEGGRPSNLDWDLIDHFWHSKKDPRVTAKAIVQNQGRTNNEQ